MQTVERALELYGAPVYVRKEIVHNKHVVEQLRERGASSSTPRPRCPRARRSCSPPTASRRASTRTPRDAQLQTIDATCPLVTKVHVEAKKFAAEGYTIVLIGHAGHEEVEGTMGEAPDQIVLVESEEDVDALEVEDPSRVAYISQTTLSVDETRAIIDRLRERFPAIVGPRTDDICYATTNRQAAVKQLARECDLVLVIGSRNSSNSNRLVEVAREHGADSHLIDNERQVRGRMARRASGWSGSPRAPARPRSWCSGWSTSSARAGTTEVEELEVVQRGRPLHAPQGDPPGDGGRLGLDGHRPLRTLVVSDLHLGRAPRARRAARHASRARGAARRRSPSVDRLVLLGDVIELRHGPLREALARRAAGARRRSGAALGPGGRS